MIGSAYCLSPSYPPPLAAGQTDSWLYHLTLVVSGIGPNFAGFTQYAQLVQKLMELNGDPSESRVQGTDLLLAKTLTETYRDLQIIILRNFSYYPEGVVSFNYKTDLKIIIFQHVVPKFHPTSSIYKTPSFTRPLPRQHHLAAPKAAAAAAAAHQGG